jgi:hypothetical protein
MAIESAAILGRRFDWGRHPDIMSAARQIAAAKSKSIGEVISELARRGLEARNKVGTHQGFPVFPVSKGAGPLTPDDVRRDEDEV